MENPIAIANYFINKANADEVEITPMKLVKLVYIAHGWYLALNGNPLISENVQAWKYGPVIQSLYYATKDYGKSPIKSQISGFLGGLSFSVGIPTITDNSLTPFLDKIWDTYKKFDGPQLSTMTHQAGTPWHFTWYTLGGKDKLGAIIPDNVIKEHYLAKSNQKK